MKEIIRVFVGIAIVICIIGWIESHHKPYTTGGTVVKMQTTQDRDGRELRYFLIIRYDEGDYQERQMSAESFFTYKEGQKYLFTRYKWEW